MMITEMPTPTTSATTSTAETTPPTIATLTSAALAQVSGGAQAPASAVCNRKQFDWMAAHMVPDNSMKPGVQRHVVANDARVCGFPMPR
ncbi:MAG: hypothetical protein H7138_25635 [Myxococcales bacterium]|nr:hypothetical protein [Myxococcales bacterium]